MGVQVRCPLCGYNRVPERFGARELIAKDVRSLGGNDGFEHVEIEPPEEARRRIEVAIAELYHRYVTVDPFLPRYDVENSVSFGEESTQKINFNLDHNVKLK
jgi:hypothetical protein